MSRVRYSLARLWHCDRGMCRLAMSPQDLMMPTRAVGFFKIDASAFDVTKAGWCGGSRVRKTEGRKEEISLKMMCRDVGGWGGIQTS